MATLLEANPSGTAGRGGTDDDRLKQNHDGEPPFSNPETTSPPKDTSNDNIDVPNHDDEKLGIKDALKKPAAFYLSFVGIQIMVFVYALDATTLAVAVPTIADELGGTTLQSFWASISYMLAVVVMQPLYAAVSDLFGRRAPLFIALILFICGSIVFATAQSMPIIVIGRVLQGLGGGGMNVLGEIIVTDMTTLRERALYLGIMALPIATGSVLGPLFGAIFSDFATWRWIGWINLPLLGLAFPLIFFFLHLRPLDTTMSSKLMNMDWIGMTLFTVGCTAFVAPLSWGGSLYPWESWKTLVPLLLGFALLIIFAIFEARPPSPIMPHRLFKSHSASLTLFGGFLHGMILYPVLQYLPLFYQAINLETRIQAAVSLLPTNITSIATAVISSVAVGILGKGSRWGVWASWTLTALGSGLLLCMNPTSTSGLRLGLPVICGAGLGGLLKLTYLPLHASLKNVDDTGLAVSLLVSFRALGGLVGLAVGSTIFASVFAPHIATMKSLPGSAILPGHTSQAVGFIPHLRLVNIPPETMHATQEAYLQALRAIWYAMIGFSGLGLISALFIKDYSVQKSELGRQRFEKQ